MSRSIEELEVEHGELLSGADLPDVCVVIVNCDGRRMLSDCLGSLDLSDYPKEKVHKVVVDNGSRDGSVQWLARAWPDVEVVANERNVGFTPACNQGAARAAASAVLVFLNNDVRVERQWLRGLVSPIVRGDCASTGSKMLSIDGKHIDHAGGGSNFHGIAIAHGYKDAPDASHDVPRRCLFACGGAMAISRAAFDVLGGFDEDFFAYYDDLDIGWRTNLAGFDVHYAPAAVCHHHHSGTSRRFPREMIRLLEVRNPLLCCLKSYDDEHLDKLLPSLLALAVRRMYVFAREPDDAEFRIERDAARPGGALSRLWRKLRGPGKTYPLNRMAAADFFGINDVLGRWEHWMALRATVQATRTRTDEELFGLFLKPLWCIEGERGYEQLQAGLLGRVGMDELLGRFTVGGDDPYK